MSSGVPDHSPSDVAIAERAADRFEHPVMDEGMLSGLHLLEADAGTGKTWTLTGLMVRALVERRLSIDSILAVTFTKAAAAELRARCRARIVDMLIEFDAVTHSVDPFISAYTQALRTGHLRDETGQVIEPQPARARLQAALARSDELAAYTLHGFCQRLLSSQPLLSGAPAELSAGARAAPAIELALRDWWRRELAGLDVGQARLLDGLGLRVSKLLGAVQVRLADPQAVALGVSPDWRRSVRQAASGLAELSRIVIAERDQLLAWIDAGKKGPARIDGSRVRKTTARKHLDALAAVADLGTSLHWPGAALEYFSTAKLAGVGANLELIGRNPLIQACDHWLTFEEQMLNPVFGGLVEEALAAVRAQLDGSLFESGIVSFDDLVRLTHEALEDPGNGRRLAASIRARYPFALVDECQDTDPLQWAILQSIWPMTDGSSAGLVLVGDPKQSIYRFRGADIHAYLDARRQWGGVTEGQRDAVAPRVSRLSENQRSDTGVIEAVNALFTPAGSFALEDIAYEGSRAGIRRRSRFESGDSPARGPFCWVQWDYPETPDVATVASACAREIRALLSNPGNRIDGVPLRPQDIAVLVNRNDEGLQVKARLRALGLSAVETTRVQVMASVEARELLAVVAAVADPGDTPLLRGALATRLIGVSLRQVEASVVERAVWFDQARRDWQRVGPRAALQRLFGNCDAPSNLARSDTPERALTNFTHMLDLLCDEPQTRLSAQAGLRWLRRVVVQDESPQAESDELELRLETDARLVRIMTLHKSKGLEFPIVFVPFCWKASKGRGAGPAVRFHRNQKDLSQSPQSNWRSFVDLNFRHPQAVIDAQTDEDFAERLRLVYVALTRAQHRCYLFGPPLLAASGSPPSALDHLLSLQSVDDRSHGLHALTRLNISELIDQPVASGADTVETDVPLRLAEAQRVLRRNVQMSSFTALVSSANSANESDADSTDDESVRNQRLTGRDRDEGTGVVRDSAANPEPSIRYSFPAGAQPGTCIHSIFELSDFSQGVDPVLVQRVLSEHGLSGQSPEQVAAWLHEVLGTRLPGIDIALDSLAARDRLTELEFDLRVDGFDADAFVTLIAQREPIELRMPAWRWSGYLRGFIDLVFRHDQRYYIVDWKTNWLGDRPGDYGLENMKASVREHAYALQYSLYQVALHRHLRIRLPDYDPARHLGGICYLFVRGVGTNADANHKENANGNANPNADASPGVYFRPADARLVLQLDQMLGAE